jgi:hypothetical protein
MSTTNASLKRKREIDEDVDLYGEAGTTEKKPRGDNSDDVTNNENSMEFERQTGEATSTAEELEWLIFLVSQEGELQVHPSFNGIDDRFVN